MSDIPVTSTEQAGDTASRAGRRQDGVLLVVVGLGLTALAFGFWRANGAEVFTGMMASAWSLCF
jgi:hypothetical protein